MTEDRRVHQRKQSSITVTISLDEFPAETSQSKPVSETPEGFVVRNSYNAKIKNHSMDGFCFMTHKKLDPGMEIGIKMVDGSTHHDLEGIPEKCHARVLWCKSIPDGQNDCFEVGVKRISNEDLPIINWTDQHFASTKCV